MAKIDDMREKAKQLVNRVLDEVYEGDAQSIDVEITVKFRPDNPDITVESTKCVNRVRYENA
jgi:hypothetical protein